MKELFGECEPDVNIYLRVSAIIEQCFSTVRFPSRHGLYVVVRLHLFRSTLINVAAM